MVHDLDTNIFIDNLDDTDDILKNYMTQFFRDLKAEEEVLDIEYTESEIA